MKTNKCKQILEALLVKLQLTTKSNAALFSLLQLQRLQEKKIQQDELCISIAPSEMTKK